MMQMQDTETEITQEEETIGFQVDPALLLKAHNQTNILEVIQDPRGYLSEKCVMLNQAWKITDL